MEIAGDVKEEFYLIKHLRLLSTVKPQVGLDLWGKEEICRGEEYFERKCASSHRAGDAPGYQPKSG
jgi:hypothetical protein